ncbi:MAG: hypothetical protein ABFS16_05420, partial [Bacteroidota bacterium]
MKHKILAILLSVIFFGLAGYDNMVNGQNEKKSVIDIGSRLELFTDYYLIDKLDNVSLILHEPVDRGSVLKFDKPWEGPFSGYCTVINDGDLFRLYYRGVPTAGKDGKAEEHTCYAESKDGVTWIKPDVKLYESNGTLNNNVILANAAPVTHNFTPFLDTRKGVNPKQKYKALGGIANTGLIPYVSEDGINWSRLQEEPVIKPREHDFDSQNVAFWSEKEQLYICYFRTWVTYNDTRYRSVARTTSKDFIN